MIQITGKSKEKSKFTILMGAFWTNHPEVVDLLLGCPCRTAIINYHPIVVSWNHETNWIMDNGVDDPINISQLTYTPLTYTQYIHENIHIHWNNSVENPMDISE